MATPGRHRVAPKVARSFLNLNEIDRPVIVGVEQGCRRASEFSASAGTMNPMPSPRMLINDGHNEIDPPVPALALGELGVRRPNSTYQTI